MTEGWKAGCGESRTSGLVRGVEKRAGPREICGNIQRQRALLLLNAFLGLEARPGQSFRDYGLEIRAKVYRWIGIPCLALLRSSREGATHSSPSGRALKVGRTNAAPAAAS